MGDKDIVKRAFKPFQNSFNQLKASYEDKSSIKKQVPSRGTVSKVPTSTALRKENGRSPFFWASQLGPCFCKIEAIRGLSSNWINGSLVWDTWHGRHYRKAVAAESRSHTPWPVPMEAREEIAMKMTELRWRLKLCASMEFAISGEIDLGFPAVSSFSKFEIDDEDTRMEMLPWLTSYPRGGCTKEIREDDGGRSWSVATMKMTQMVTSLHPP
ncbi:hypothetical protein LR48_Vigan11g030600 [Vigna angularis]|uniref:Uncharacterized protein n=1 Tax=Phaseolus angularis TaxID=3914 RepID=A0A0L9VR85_PHAAN|nr:hypothetical protein LR48_Vigan11g030600 [Vigna angularis]